MYKLVGPTLIQFTREEIKTEVAGRLDLMNKRLSPK